MSFTKNEEKLIEYAHDCFKNCQSPLRPTLLKTVGIDVDKPNYSTELKMFFELMGKSCNLKNKD